MNELVDNNCYSCVNRRNVPGDHHIRCINPDMDMEGDSHGIKNGWFIYPLLFDPIWMTRKCKNFEKVSVVSPPVSPETDHAANDAAISQ